MATNSNPLDRQVGGGHYKDQGPQHVEFCQMNRIPWCESCALKYILRHRRKNGREDLEKAIHYIEFIMGLDYARRAQVPQDMGPKLWVIKLEGFLKDKPLTKGERKAIELVLSHQCGGGDERKLMDAINLLRGIIKAEYEDRPAPQKAVKGPPEPELEGIELL